MTTTTNCLVNNLSSKTHQQNSSEQTELYTPADGSRQQDFHVAVNQKRFNCWTEINVQLYYLTLYNLLKTNTKTTYAMVYIHSTRPNHVPLD